jgi:glycosyltransferase involved in cell wall biosynthesis
LPLVEAHAVGLPDVARDNGAFRDLAGDAAVLVARDAGAAPFAEALAELDDPARRAELAARGRVLRPRRDRWEVLDAAVQAGRAAR